MQHKPKPEPVTPVYRVCGECGAPYEGTPGGRATCTGCTGPEDRARPGRGTTHRRGYGARWERLSKRARALQPFCLDCGTTENLTADHTPTAWERFDSGKSIRLQDIDVVCLPCNVARGPARGPRARAVTDPEP